jgi:hypothetical protein
LSVSKKSAAKADETVMTVKRTDVISFCFIPNSIVIKISSKFTKNISDY